MVVTNQRCDRDVTADGLKPFQRDGVAEEFVRVVVKAVGELGAAIEPFDELREGRGNDLLVR